MLQTEREVLLQKLAIIQGQSQNEGQNINVQGVMLSNKQKKQLLENTTSESFKQMQQYEQQQLGDYMPRPIRKLAQDVHTMSVVLNQPVVVLTPEDFFPQLHSNTTSSSSLEPEIEADLQHHKITYYKRSGQSSPPPPHHLQNTNLKNIDYVNSSRDFQSTSFVGRDEVREGECLVATKKRKNSLKQVRQFVTHILGGYKKTRSTRGVGDRSGGENRLQSYATIKQKNQRVSADMNRVRTCGDEFNYATWNWQLRNNECLL